MRKHGLLNPERGSAPIESIFAIALLMLLTVGTIQVALTLYGRNVVSAAAHEAARAAVERGATPEQARAVAEDTVKRAGGHLVEDLSVSVEMLDMGAGRVVRVALSGSIDVLGPVPIAVPIEAHASARSAGEIE